MTLGREPQYDGRAEQYARGVEENPNNAYVERPAFLQLLGDVSGLRVLDAGCGSGRYTDDLVRRGADAIGFDQSADNIALARERVPGAEFRVHDLADPLDWLADSSFDRVSMAMALHYLDDRVAALRELHRVLRPAGALVLSTRHPIDWYLRYGGSYFDTGIVEDEWEDGWRLRWWRQPLEHTLDEFATAGFALERLVEPRPVPGLAERSSDEYELLSKSPVFIAFRLGNR